MRTSFLSCCYNEESVLCLYEEETLIKVERRLLNAAGCMISLLLLLHVGHFMLYEASAQTESPHVSLCRQFRPPL